jgi:hypothetical protein
LIIIPTALNDDDGDNDDNDGSDDDDDLPVLIRRPH